jgi:hypothetical protein
MATHKLVSGQGPVTPAERPEGAGRAEKVEGRQYGRPDVHDLGALELLQGWNSQTYDGGYHYDRD